MFGKTRQAAVDEIVAKFAASLPAGARVLDVGAGDEPYRELFRRQKYYSHDRRDFGHTAFVGDITELRPIGLAKCRRCAERPVGPPGKCYGFEFVHAVGQYVEWARARIFFPGNPTEVRE